MRAMPTYAYTCPNGHEFEVFERKITDKTRAKCPTCGKMATRQISGGAGLVFKGSGFYVTDYKGGKKDSAKEGGEKKPESKPDAKTESKPKKDAE